MSSNTLPVCPKTGSTSPSLTVHLCLHTAPLREIGNAPARTGRLSLNDAVQFFKFDAWNSERVHTSSSEWYKEAWIYATATDDELGDPKYEHAKQWGQSFRRFNMTRPTMITVTCKQIDDLWQREPA